MAQHMGVAKVRIAPRRAIWGAGADLIINIINYSIYVKNSRPNEILIHPTNIVFEIEIFKILKHM